MTAKTPDKNAPPIGLQAFSLLAIKRRLSPVVKESVWALLADRGELWSTRGMRERDVPERTLCTEQAFDSALGQFLERVPGAAGALADHRAVHDENSRGQAAVDRATDDYKQRMGFNPSDGAK